MEKINADYAKLFKKLDKINKEDDDNEAGHILQDKIYRKFVKDIASGKITNMKDIQTLAKNMNKYVVKQDSGRWYA